MEIKFLIFMVISWMSQEVIKLVSTTDSLDLVQAKCSSKLDFKTIQEFQKFMDRFLVLDPSRPEVLKEPLKTCLSHKQALIDLKELVDEYDKERPCKHSEIDKLHDYARKYFAIKKIRPWSLKFFTLFGVNIGLRCKLNLLAHVKQADNEVDQLDFIYSMASPTGWNVLINEYTKKTMKFGSSSNAGNSVVNRVAKLVPGLNLIEQLDYMQFDRPLDKTSAQIEGGIESDTYELEASSAEAAQQVHGYLMKIVESCRNLDQFYYNSVLSLARLNDLGLLVSLKGLDEMQENSLMLHRWLAAASFCQLLVRVRAELNIRDPAKGVFQLGLKVIHDDGLLESRRTLYSYVAKFEEISEESRANVWLASVSDGKWLRKHRETLFVDGKSVAIKRLGQFIKGLERDISA